MSPQETSILKEDLKNIKEEIIHEFHRGAEIISGELKLLAERIFALNQKIERFRQELKDEDNARSLITVSLLAVSSTTPPPPGGGSSTN